jgi:histone H3/H4
MSHHEHDHDHDHDHDHGDQARGGPDNGFLDLEISKVMYSEAEGITREAFRELLKEAAKRRLLERWGDRITALANLAVDELLDDVAANLEIEARIGARNHARKAVEERVTEILARAPGASESGDASDAPAQ